MIKAKYFIKLLTLSIIFNNSVLGESTNRGVWFWGDTGKEYGSKMVVGKPGNEDKVIEIFREFGIKKIYGSYQNRPITEPSVIAAWNSKLSSNGIESYILFSEESWIQPVNRSNMCAKIQEQFIDFNSGRDGCEQFRGIHFDLEPHRLKKPANPQTGDLYWCNPDDPEHDTSEKKETCRGGNKTLLNELRNTFQKARDYLVNNSPDPKPENILIFADIPVWFDTSTNIGFNDSERDQWFDSLVGLNNPLMGITLMAFDRQMSGVESGINWELTRYPDTTRIALEADMAQIGGTVIWSNFASFLDAAHQLETNNGYSIGIDIQSFSKFMDGINLKRRVFRDNFDGDTLDLTTWQIGTNTIGRTMFGNAPTIANGKATFHIDTYNSNNPGGNLKGTQINTLAHFSQSGLFEFEYRLKIKNPTSNGLVAGLFTYGFRDLASPMDDRSDEIDLKLLSNWINDTTNSELIKTVTRDETNETTGAIGSNAEIDLQISGLNVSEYNNYVIKWHNDRVEWHVNYMLKRVESSVVPDNEMQLFINYWAPNSNYTSAFDAILQPVANSENNTRYNFEIDYIEIRMIDHDCDLMSDLWEISHFGDTSKNAFDDEDGDGTSNLREYLDVTISPNSTVNFKKGWNFVSLNVTPSDLTISNVFADLLIDNKLVRIIGDDKNFDPNFSGPLSVLNSMDTFIPGKGYWVKVTNNATLIFDVANLVSELMPFNLESGWNNVGYILPQQTNIRIALDELIDESNPDNSKLLHAWGENKTFDPRLDDCSNTLLTLNPGNGYWIKVSTAHTNFRFQK